MEEPHETESNQIVLKLSAASATAAYPKVSANGSMKYISFGAVNMFPQEIIALNAKSPVNSSIIESTVTYICGKGVKASTSKYIGRPNPAESWDEVLERLAKDYKTFGGFYMQIIKNGDSATVSVFHQDFSEVRIGQIDERGQPLTFKISNDWTKTSGKMKPVEIDVWTGIGAAKDGVAYMFYYWNYAAGLKRYCVPDYYPAIKYIEADGQLGDFYNNSIANGFTPSVVIKMPSNPDKPKKDKFYADMKKAFTGAKGASNIVILWGENGKVAPEIVPFNASANADIYNNVEAIVFQKIISAHRLSSPTLAGVSGSGNLSGNAAEIIDAYVLYNYTVIEKMRAKILDKCNIFQKINGLKPLVVEELDVLPAIRATEEDTDPADAAKLSRKPTKFERLFKRLTSWK